MTLAERLRSETRDLHDRIESTVRVGGEGFTRDDYVAFLASTYGFVAPCEVALRRLELRSLIPDPSTRFKAERLAEDLAACGVPTEAVPRCTDLPPLDTPPEALGYLYVLEGSSLGSQIVVRQVRDRLAGVVPLAYLTGYGGRTGTMWQSFKRVLDAWGAAAPAEQDRVIASARATFASLTTCYLSSSK